MNFDYEGKTARIEIPDFCVVIVKVICFKINICQILRNIHLATPNPRASPIDHISYVITSGHKLMEKGFIVQITI